MRTNHPIVLASGSPRRRELLKELFSEFEVVVSDVDEDALTVSDPYVTAESLAQAKARAVFLLRPNSLVIGGDTVVALPLEDGSYVQFSKPRSTSDAEDMLSKLSGRTHLVITGICLVREDSETVFSDTSKVTFRSLADQEIRDYVATGVPMDKAGGYAIQQGADRFITELEGSLSNVIGLPLEKLSLVLQCQNTKDDQDLFHPDRLSNI